MRKRILVTGGAGFLGSHLCERLLRDGHEVVCLDNFFTGSRQNVEHLLDDHRFELVRGDVNDPRVLEVDEVYHLACPASPIHYQRNPVRTIRTCVIGTLNMLEMCREVHAKLLIASTSEVYGDPEVHPQTEAYWGHVNPIGPRACYDEGKRCAEAVAVSFARQYSVPVRIPRIFNTYGPRMHENDGRVVSNFVVQALRGEPITVYGEGRQTRSFCFATDLIEGFVRLMASDLDARPVNLGNPDEQTIGELAHRIVQLTGSRSTIENRPLPKDDPVRRKPDISLAKDALGWTPKVSLEEGLKAVVEDFRARLASEGRVG
ncbi:MAG: SDR family oxidoreductase [Deltaproteobacteria bacterium]|nr:SDR family oxidoreductase [Deltaproteobacteria bacterium]